MAVFADPAHEELFQRDGLVTIPLLSKEEIDHLLGLWKTLSGSVHSGFYASVCSSDSEFRRRVSSAVAEVMQPHVERLIPGYTTTCEGFIAKPRKDSTNAVPLHQDYTLVDPRRDTGLTLFCPLVDVDIEMGCLHYVAGSHTFRHHINAFARTSSVGGYRMMSNPSPWDQVRDKLCDECSTPVPVKGGVCLFWHERVLHWSPPNNSTRDRICVGGVCIPRHSPIRLHIWDQNQPNKLELFDVQGPMDTTLPDICDMQPPYPSHWKSAGDMEYPVARLLTNEDVEPLVVANR